MNPEVNQGDWLITHGTDDEVLQVTTTRAQVKLFNEHGFKIDYREYMKPHTIDPRRELPDIQAWLSSRV